MTKFTSMLALFTAGLLSLLVVAADGQQPIFPAADDPPGAEANLDADTGEVEPLTRGPIHEAFADPYSADPEAPPIVPKAPPEAIDELPPDERPEGSNIAWLPGYWAWDDEHADFLWVSGFWRDVPPERTWVPGYWAEIQGGWQWVSGYWADLQQAAGEQPGQIAEVEYLPPPPEPIEAGPSIPAPAPDHIYIPGNWAWRETRYLWRPGIWTAPRPGWVYCPPRYHWTPVGYTYCNGYWDYPLQNRGLLFAPVYVHHQHIRPDFVYRPSFAIATNALYYSMFARPSRGQYYFGDYFGQRHHDAGYIPWHRHQVARNVPSPLFAHYRSQQDRQWVSNLNTVYNDRREGRSPPPPHSYKSQTTVIRNITNNTTNNKITINNQQYTIDNSKNTVQQLSLVQPLRQVSRDKTVKLTTVSKERLVETRTAVADYRKASVQRRDQVASLARPMGQANTKPLRAKATFVPKLASVTPAAERKVVNLPPRLDTAKFSDKGGPPQAPRKVAPPQRLDLKPLAPRVDLTPPRAVEKKGVTTLPKAVEKKALVPMPIEKKAVTTPPKTVEKKAITTPPQPIEKKAVTTPPKAVEEKKTIPIPPRPIEKKAVTIPPRPLEEKKAPILRPVEEKKAVSPPRYNEEKKAAPILRPVEEKKAPPMRLSEEKKAPPILRPVEGKVAPPARLIEEKKAAPPIRAIEKKAAPPPIEKKVAPRAIEKKVAPRAIEKKTVSLPRTLNRPAVTTRPQVAPRPAPRVTPRLPIHNVKKR